MTVMKSLTVIKFFFLFLLANSAAFADAPKSADRLLPITLRVLEYDKQLDAFLLAGDFSNDLSQALRAWRGNLRLTDGEHQAAFFLEQQSKRPILPGFSGVWNIWIKHQPESPDHRALQHFDPTQVEVSLRLLRVLYVDGTQQGFD